MIEAKSQVNIEVCIWENTEASEFRCEALTCHKRNFTIVGGYRNTSSSSVAVAGVVAE